MSVLWNEQEGPIQLYYCTQKQVIMALFMPFYIITPELQYMQKPFQSNVVKPQGIIIRRCSSQIPQQQRRPFSLDTPPLPSPTITTLSSTKSPGQIRTITRSNAPMIDEEVYYNADLYPRPQKPKDRVTYQQVPHLLPIQQHPQPPAQQHTTSQRQTPVTSHSGTSRRLQSIQEEGGSLLLGNIHEQFDLDKYRQIYPILKRMTECLGVDEPQLLGGLRHYIAHVSRWNVDDVSEMKLAPNKREVVKQAIMFERQAVVLLAMVVAVAKLQQMKNYCSNLLKYAMESCLVCLNILTQESSEGVLKLMRTEGKEHLIGKSFDILRSINDIMADLIAKVAKVDLLFAEEFFKIVENYRQTSVRACLYALLTFFAFYINAVKADHVIPFMAFAPAPFIVDSPTHQYILVIDFMHVFLDQSRSPRKQKKRQPLPTRPYSTYFLKQMAKYYEIISFSEFMPADCNRIINAIDETGFVRHRLYKYHLDGKRGSKEVSRIGRDTQKVVLLDTVALQETTEDGGNLLQVGAWRGESADAQLAQICPLLALIVVKRLSAIESLRKVREAVSVNSSLGLKYINCGLNL